MTDKTTCTVVFDNSSRTYTYEFLPGQAINAGDLVLVEGPRIWPVVVKVVDVHETWQQPLGYDGPLKKVLWRLPEEFQL